jgi:hypothetical protein
MRAAAVLRRLKDRVKGGLGVDRVGIRPTRRHIKLGRGWVSPGNSGARDPDQQERVGCGGDHKSGGDHKKCNKKIPIARSIGMAPPPLLLGFLWPRVLAGWESTTLSLSFPDCRRQSGKDKPATSQYKHAKKSVSILPLCDADFRSLLTLIY